MNTNDPLDRASNPELTGLIDALDELTSPPADPARRERQIQQAVVAARNADSVTIAPIGWGWRRAAPWQAVAVAAAVVAIVAGLGADDRLPEPAQRAVSSVADAVGLDVPDGSTRDGEVGELDAPEGTAGDSGTTPASPAEPGTPGEPATPATPAEPGNDSGGPVDPPRAGPATPAEPGEPGDPADPATPADPPEAPSEGAGSEEQRSNSGPVISKPETPPTVPVSTPAANSGQGVPGDPDEDD